MKFSAAEVLTTSNPIVRLKPLAEATVESRTKARYDKNEFKLQLF